MKTNCCSGGTWWNNGGTRVPPKTDRYIEVNDTKMKRWNISPGYTALSKEKKQNANHPACHEKIFFYKKNVRKCSTVPPFENKDEI